MTVVRTDSMIVEETAGMMRGYQWVSNEKPLAWMTVGYCSELNEESQATLAKLCQSYSQVD